ncbi:hypothetical protein CGC21_30755 [Leishmania donovani]|uniref:Uncharacterized protein n=1 Tax=Leishmania donovani TaxID=5661 RepID=A0A504XJQ8_LEIDO|nr:hypothetical protein CGC21_30755 [Leishmania donovani]
MASSPPASLEAGQQLRAGWLHPGDAWHALHDLLNKAGQLHGRQVPNTRLLAPLSDAEKVDCLRSGGACQRSRSVTSHQLGRARQLARHPQPVACKQLLLHLAERHLAMRLLSHGPQHAKPAHSVHSSPRCTAAKANSLASEGDRGDTAMFLLQIELVRSCAEKRVSDASACGMSHPSLCASSSRPLPLGESPLESVTAIGGDETGLNARAAGTWALLWRSPARQHLLHEVVRVCQDARPIALGNGGDVPAAAGSPAGEPERQRETITPMVRRRHRRKLPARPARPPVLEHRELADRYLGPRPPPPKNKREESRHGQRQSNGIDNGRRELFTQQAVEPAGVVQRVLGDAAGARARAALGDAASALEAGRRGRQRRDSKEVELAFWCLAEKGETEWKADEELPGAGEHVDRLRYIRPQGGAERRRTGADADGG